MPANRSDRTRDEKAAELLAIAQRLFLTRGYAGTTMAAIAAEAGVASNVVHWYFASKDELFARAMEGLQVAILGFLERELAAAPPGEEAKRLESLLVELIGRLAQGQGLITSVHERANHCEVVAAVHERAHARYAETLGRAVERCGVPEPERDLVVRALLLAFESLVMHRAEVSETRRMIGFLVSRLIP